MTRHRTLRRTASTALLLAMLVPAPALAHPGHEFGQDLLAGTLHPLTGLDHLLMIIAISAWASLLAPAGRIVVATCLALFVGIGAVIFMLLRPSQAGNANININTNLNSNQNSNIGFDSNFNFNVNSMLPPSNLNTNVNANVRTPTPSPSVTPTPTPRPSAIASETPVVEITPATPRTSPTPDMGRPRTTPPAGGSSPRPTPRITPDS